MGQPMYQHPYPLELYAEQRRRTLLAEARNDSLAATARQAGGARQPQTDAYAQDWARAEGAAIIAMLTSVLTPLFD
jgi:hypothetical protein